MKKSYFWMATSLIGLGAAASAHPTGVPFETRGECEVAFAESSKTDRERLVQFGVFESQGAAQRTFNETFACEYDEETDAWYINYIGGQ